MSSIIGFKIQKVEYYTINDIDSSPFFENFDHFDLGINIEFTNGSHFHIGYKNNDRPELAFDKYEPQKYYSDFRTIDATHRWQNILDFSISDLDILYAHEEWNLPVKCVFKFKNQISYTLILGEEINLDSSIPNPLYFVDGAYFYLFLNENIPAFEHVKIRYEEFLDELPVENRKIKIKRQTLIGVLLLLTVLSLSLLHYLKLV